MKYMDMLKFCILYLFYNYLILSKMNFNLVQGTPCVAHTQITKDNHIQRPTAETFAEGTDGSIRLFNQNYKVNSSNWENI